MRKRLESLEITPGLRLCGMVIKRKRLVRKDDHQLVVFGRAILKSYEKVKSKWTDRRQVGRCMGMKLSQRDLV